MTSISVAVAPKEKAFVTQQNGVTFWKDVSLRWIFKDYL